MIVKLLRNEQLVEDSLHIHYQQMNNKIQSIISLAGETKSVLLAKRENEEVKVPIEEILYYETVDKKYFIYMSDEVYETQFSLADIEEKLQDHGFVRINKSTIVNCYQVKSLKADANMKIKAFLYNGEVVKVTRHYRKSFYGMIKTITLQKES